MTFDRLVREFIWLWPAWTIVVEHVTRSDPRTVEPQSVFGAACAVDRDRLAALLYGHHIGDSLEDAQSVLEELLVMARDGKRPRYGAELGLTREMFKGSP